MKLIDRFKAGRRRAKMARLRREIASLQSLVQRLSPDYDHDTLRQTVASISAKQRELAALTTQEVDSHVQP